MADSCQSMGENATHSAMPKGGSSKATSAVQGRAVAPSQLRPPPVRHLVIEEAVVPETKMVESLVPTTQADEGVDKGKRANRARGNVSIRSRTQERRSSRRQQRPAGKCAYAAGRRIRGRARRSGEIGARHDAADALGQLPRRLEAHRALRVRSPAARIPERRVQQLRVEPVVARITLSGLLKTVG